MPDGTTRLHLPDGTPYLVALLAIDKFGNASGTYFTSKLTPVPATDFWEDLHNQGSGVEGGFCLISQTFGDDSGLTNTLRHFRDDTLASTAFGRWLTDVYYALSFNLHGSLIARIAMAIVLLPFIAFALLWHVLTLPGLLAIIAFLVLARRRSKRLRLQLATATVFLLLPVPAAVAIKPMPISEIFFSSSAKCECALCGGISRPSVNAWIATLFIPASLAAFKNAYK
jgi:hypothetical protein